METEDRKDKAYELFKRLHPEGTDSDKKDKPLSDNPLYLSLQALVEFVELLADTNNDAFTQLDKGKLKNYFIDETELFSLAEHFAEHPLDDIAEELRARGITEKKVIKSSKVPKEQAERVLKESKYSVNYSENSDGTVTIEEYQEVPMVFVVQPLRDFAKKWKMNRHPVNRARVDEIIRLAAAARIGEMAHVPERRERTGLPESTNLRF